MHKKFLNEDFTSRSNWALQLSNYTLSIRAKSPSALTLAIARERCVAAIAAITTTVPKIIDVCQKNYRYLQAAREDERRLFNQIHKHHLQPMSTALIETSSGGTSISTVRIREESIAVVDSQDVLLVALWLEDTVRGVEKFTQIHQESLPIAPGSRDYRPLASSIRRCVQQHNQQ